MSGAEAVAVLGVISSIISIVDGTKKVYDAAKNPQGLPEAFRTIAGRLPVVETILDSAKKRIEQGNVGGNSCKGVKDVVEACEKKATKLDMLFKKAIPKNGASDIERYFKAIKAYGKGNEVENLMKGMLVDVQLLACERGIDTATQAQQELIIEAVKEVPAILPSVPEHFFQETGFTNSNYGPGTQNNAQGEYVAQGSARQYNSAGGQMHFGSMERYEEACMTALFLTDPKDDREQLIHAKGSRVDNTCKWIKSNKLYKSWLNSRSQLLWVSGGPGKGKTMLSIFLAEELEQTAKHSEDKLFLQYFCDNKDEKRRTAVTILRGLIFQLLQSRYKQKLLDHILPSFKIQKESLFTGSSFEALWRIFESMVRDPILCTAYCVLDGLDECDEASLEVLLRKFVALLSTETHESSACHLKLIILSRDLPDLIPELLSKFPRIRLDPDADTEINDDIRQFIKVKVDELSKYKQYPEPLRVYVKEVFQNRAQGTFLWVGIVAKMLEKYKATEVENALGRFPPGLDDLYARMLLQIDNNRREIAAKILRWVVMAVRPLTLSELSVAIDTTVPPSGLFTLDEVIRDQVSYCGSFLTIKKVEFSFKNNKDSLGNDGNSLEENEVGLIHQSAKDYLLRKTPDSNPELENFRVKEELGNIEIARKCLNYLENGALAGGTVYLKKDVYHLRDFPLLSYAALHWHEHARFLDCSEDVFDLSRSFYSKKSPVREAWLKTYWSKFDHYIHNYHDDRAGSFTPLHLASYFGILPLAENLLKKGWLNNVNRKFYLGTLDIDGEPALMWAAEGGHEAVVRLLLENGADVTTQARLKQTALILASRSGHEAVVRLLLEKGADIEAKDKHGDTALMYAAERGRETEVRLLLENGADIEAKNFSGDKALLLATIRGHEAVVRLLLAKGADIEAKDGYGRTALIIAADCGHEAVVRLLFEKGADIEAKDEHGRTALIKADICEHETVVRFLLENGAAIEAKNFSGDKVLLWATIRGHEAVVRLLLEKWADIEVKDEFGQTALMIAAGHDKAVVRLLLKKGADIEAEDTHEKTALTWAAEHGHETLMRLLLEEGADIEAQDIFGTALIKAAKCGHETVVRLLLEKGADIEAQSMFGTALIMATKCRHEAVVRLLFEKGADIEAKDEDGRTALIWAAIYGYETVVQLLLEKEANIEAKYENGKTALTSAVQGGHEAVVRLFLGKKADIEAKNISGDTALLLAAKRRHEAMVRLLLEKGANIEAQNIFGETALRLAAKRGHEAMVRLLLDKGASIEAKNIFGKTTLRLARGHEAVVQLLLEKGAKNYNNR